MLSCNNTQNYHYWHSAMQTSFLWFFMTLFFAIHGLLLSAIDYYLAQIIYVMLAIVFLAFCLVAFLRNNGWLFVLTLSVGLFSLIFYSFPEENIDFSLGFKIFWYCLVFCSIFLWLALKQRKRAKQFLKE